MNNGPKGGEGKKGDKSKKKASPQIHPPSNSQPKRLLVSPSQYYPTHLGTAHDNSLRRSWPILQRGAGAAGSRSRLGRVAAARRRGMAALGA